MPDIADGPVTAAQKEQFEQDGYFVLDRVISDDHIAMLRGECGKAIGHIHQDMDRSGSNKLGISVRDSRYFVSTYHGTGPLSDFLFSDLMANICKATLGVNAYLFFEQYVVKAAERGMSFSWHQDSGYVGFEHRPYLTCWCALDDVNEENGTVYILPYDRAGTRNCVPHVYREETNDHVGYFGDDPGIPVIVPSGSIAVFSSTVFHRSGANTTSKLRRIYLAQYSMEPINKPDGSGPMSHAEPFLIDGFRVR